jgi:hypothetical protein
MAEYIATLQQTAVGTDFTGVAASTTGRVSNGTLLQEACTTAGRVDFPVKWWTRISLIAIKLDGAAHALAGSNGTVTLYINSIPHVLEPSLTNEDDWIWKGGELVVPPKSYLLVTFAPVGVTTTVQQLTVVHEKYREVRDGSIM